VFPPFVVLDARSFVVCFEPSACSYLGSVLLMFIITPVEAPCYLLGSFKALIPIPFIGILVRSVILVISWCLSYSSFVAAIVLSIRILLAHANVGLVRTSIRRLRDRCR
jgi:hypothetical protein